MRLRVSHHDGWHQLADPLHPAEIEFHAAVKNNRTGHGMRTGTCVYSANGFTKGRGIELCDVLKCNTRIR